MLYFNIISGRRAKSRRQLVLKDIKHYTVTQLRHLPEIWTFTANLSLCVLRNTLHCPAIVIHSETTDVRNTISYVTNCAEILLTTTVELGYNVMKGTEYFVSL
jgi:hypothetical protein